MFVLNSTEVWATLHKLAHGGWKKRLASWLALREPMSVLRTSAVVMDLVVV